jgi:hypothetical protein
LFDDSDRLDYMWQDEEYHSEGWIDDDPYYYYFEEL